MRILKFFFAIVAVLSLISFAAAQDIAKLSKFLTQSKGNYVGSEACGVCHQAIYDWWFGSGHAHKLRPASEARGAGVPHPDSVTWDDVKWVIGGFKWKARFIGTDGYIITQGGKNQFNLATRSWTDYHADEVKPYSCGACHTTGYNESGHQEFLPGVVGTWVFPSIHCEECHGAGKDHILGGGDKTKITVDRSSAQCGRCHYRTDPAIIPAKGGFIRHHEQYNEFLKSDHAEVLECVSCHDPHKTGHESVKLSC
ncbi:MAG: multiheme c-type cytochrome, partial [Candidatus Aminicenantales bacterium]